MNDLDLLKRLPAPVEPPDDAAKDRMRSLVNERVGQSPYARRTPVRARRSAVRIGVIAAAAVLGGAAAASAVADHLWTTDQPVAIPIASSDQNNAFFGDISDPNQQVDAATLPSAVAEFAPAIRLPEGGSFDEWVTYVERYSRPLNWQENTRAAVVTHMVFVAQCQWTQQWLTATDASNDARAAQTIRVLPEIITWSRGAGLVDDGSMDTLVEEMNRGDVARVQSAENGCAFTGSWGSTSSEQDAKATGDLTPAIQSVRSYLLGGGVATDFGWQTGNSLAPAVNWTDPATQPAPLFPGQIYIAPTTDDAVMLISPSESGTRFCAVVTETTVLRGAVDPERYPPDPNSLNTPWDDYPGPVGCTTGGWPG